MYKQYIEEHKDFPIEGINYLDLNPIYKDGNLLKTITKDCIGLIKDFDFDYIGLVESRGFILGSIIAHELGKGVILLRSKRNRLPGKTHTIAHTLEYGESVVEVQEGEGKVLVFDDVLATGGTVNCVSSLLQDQGKEIHGLITVVELSKLKGRSRLNFPVESMISL